MRNIVKHRYLVTMVLNLTERSAEDNYYKTINPMKNKMIYIFNETFANTATKDYYVLKCTSYFNFNPLLVCMYISLT